MRKNNKANIAINIFFILICLFSIVPLFSVLNVSLKSTQDFLNNPTALTIKPTLDNFAVAWERADMLNSFKNSIILAFFTPLGICIIATMIAFPIARKHFKGANLLYTILVISLFLPMTAGLIPKIILFKKLHLINHLYGLIISGWANIALPILIISGFIKSIPRELDEAASIDGCGYFRYIFKVIFPLSRPAWVTVFILNMLTSWNDFIGPYIFLTDPSKRPISTALHVFVGTYSIDYTTMCAGVIIALIPIVATFILLQRYIISGMVSGAIKG